MLKKYDIEVKTIDEIIYEIIDTVDKWEKHLKNEGIIRRSTQAAPPQSLWLIQLLYYLYKNRRLTLQ
jgi:translation initiation factor IF-2